MLVVAAMAVLAVAKGLWACRSEQRSEWTLLRQAGFCVLNERG